MLTEPTVSHPVSTVRPVVLAVDTATPHLDSARLVTSCLDSMQKNASPGEMS